MLLSHSHYGGNVLTDAIRHQFAKIIRICGHSCGVANIREQAPIIRQESIVPLLSQHFLAFATVLQAIATHSY